MRPLIALAFLLFVVNAHAGDGDYAVSKIAPALLKNASVVKRMEQVRFEIKDVGSATYYYKYAVTILNETGDRFAGISENYDKFHSIKSIEGNLYDADGKKIKSVKKADIGDFSAVGESFADDSRVKTYHFYHKIYPYTVEYEVEKKQDELMFMPSWMPQEDDGYSVEQSSYEVVMPASYSIRHKEYNYTGGPLVTNEKNKKIFTWSVKNLTALNDEYAAPGWQKLTTTVMIGPTEFSIDSYSGNMNTWQDFGKFVYALKQNRDVLPDNVKQAVHQIADATIDIRKKIALLYEYLQKNTRYISIQLGIGGWQPLDAAFVSKKGYGDCKALTNYMFSLLKEAGVNSYYTIVKAGQYKRDLVEDFPGQQFNHVILSIPLEKDTMWLECTSQTLPAGYMSNFTSNRYALMIKEDGGYLVRTPEYKLNDNQQCRTIKATLNEEGQLSAKISTRYSGMEQDDLYEMIHSLPKQKQLEQLRKTINLGTFDVKNLAYQENRTAIPSIDEEVDLVVENYAQVSGKRLFITPNIYNRSGTKLKDEERMHDIEFMFEYRDIDSVEIQIPKGFSPEALPHDTNVKSKFGNYSANFQLIGDRIVFFRKLERNSGRFPKSDYKELVSFYESIYKSDRSRMVLVKKDE